MMTTPRPNPPRTARWVAVALLGTAISCGGSRERDEIRLEVPDDPTISMAVWFRVGSQDDPPGKEGLAYLTARLVSDGGTETHDYEQILEALYPMAAGYDATVDREMTVLRGRVHRDNFDDYLALFSDALLRPAFDPSDFERIKSETLNYLENTLRYASDEELAKAALYAFVFEGTRYAHPVEGLVASVRSITLDDVKSFWRRTYTRDNATLALGGGFDDAVASRLEDAVAALPPGRAEPSPPPDPKPIEGIQVLLVDKPGADASISFGFPIDVRRGEDEFYALWLANSWFGEHRNASSHLYQVIRAARGLNYGDYSYIEAFPQGGVRQMPPTNVARRRQIFEVWIRTLPADRAHFALRAALRELKALVEEGLTEEQFELTRNFLSKYVLHFAPTTQARLGYAIDDRFYGIEGEGHLARFRRRLEEMTHDEVQRAIRDHLRAGDLKIAIVTGNAEALARALVADAPSPIAYDTPKDEAILAEDREIARFPIAVSEDAIRIVPVTEIFEDSAP